MLERPPDLPEYDNPPVDEVTLGLQYSPVEPFETVVAQYWETIREDYPTTQYQPRIDTPVEQFTPEALIVAAPAASNAGRSGRTWFVSRDDSFLIQIQNDRFYYNWRRRTDPYPRFERIYQLFTEHYERYRELVAAVTSSSIQVLQAEMSYINWIVDEPMHNFLRPGAATDVSVTDLDRYAEQQQWAASYLRRRDGRPVARLTVTCGPGVRIGPSLQRGSHFALTYRAPLSPAGSRNEIRDSFSIGREMIVRTFTSLTTTASHEWWGRRR